MRCWRLIVIAFLALQVSGCGASPKERHAVQSEKSDPIIPGAKYRLKDDPSFVVTVMGIEWGTISYRPVSGFENLEISLTEFDRSFTRIRGTNAVEHEDKGF